jgi:hypothetical protein
MGISFICWFRVIFCVFWSFIAEELDGVEDEGSGDTMFGVLTLLEAFLNVSLRFACITDKVYGIGIIRISGLSDIKLKEICCKYFRISPLFLINRHHL